MSSKLKEKLTYKSNFCVDKNRGGGYELNLLVRC